MAEIKSALEIALAKTEGMEADKEKLAAKEIKVEGRKAALSFFEGNTDSKELVKALKAHKNKSRNAFLVGVAESLMSNLKLPADEEYKSDFEKAGEGLAAVSDSPSQVEQMFSQLGQFFDQYIENRMQMEKQLVSQFEPVLKRKEEALAAQTGSRIKLDPMDVPEFQKAYSQNMGNLSKNYLEALNQAKGQLKQFLGLEE